MVSNQIDYDLSIFTNWFHNLPHLKYNFERVNATFDYDDRDYMESIYVFMTWPLIALLLVLLIYTIHSICLCLCSFNTNYYQTNINSNGCKCFIILVSSLATVTFIVGLIGTFKVNSALNTAQQSSDRTSGLVNDLLGITNNVSYNINIADDIFYIKKIIYDNRLVMNQTRLDNVLNEANEATLRINQLFLAVNSVDFNYFSEQINHFEDIRWIVTLSTICFLILIAFLFICGAYSHCLLVLLIILAVISLIICSFMISFTLASTVMMSDFCVEAKPFILSKMERKTTVEKNILEYYIECNDIRNPFQQMLYIAEHSILNVSHYINQFDIKFEHFCENDESCRNNNNMQTAILSTSARISFLTHQTTEVIYEVPNAVDCGPVNQELNESLSALCKQGIDGLVMMFFNAIFSSLSFAILLFCGTYYARVNNPYNAPQYVERI